jgi:hypothetical protein
MEFINGPNFKKLNDSINEVAPKIPEEEAAGKKLLNELGC